MAEIIPACSVSGLPEASSEPVRTLEFQCKCGCDLFRIEVEVYADGCYSQMLVCSTCGQDNVVTAPITNGPH